jgi:hypothetical protein
MNRATVMCPKPLRFHGETLLHHVNGTQSLCPFLIVSVHATQGREKRHLWFPSMRRSQRGWLLTAIPTFLLPRFIGPRRQTSCHSPRVSSFTMSHFSGSLSCLCDRCVWQRGRQARQQSHCSTPKPSRPVCVCLRLKASSFQSMCR